MGFEWMDFDHEIIRLHGKLAKIVASEGEQALLDYEAEAILAAQPGKCVFSCGGSSIYRPKAMEHLGKISEIIYLEVPLKVLKQRMVDYEARGVIGGKNLMLKELYAKRHPLYKKFADYTVSDTSGDPDRQYQKLLKLTKEILSAKT